LVKRLNIFTLVITYLCQIQRGPQYFWFSGKRCEHAANRRLLLSKKRSGRDSSIRG